MQLLRIRDMDLNPLTRFSTVLLERPEVILVRGKVDMRMGVLSIIADQVRPLQRERATG